MMLNSKRILQMVRKWQNTAIFGRRRNMSTRIRGDPHLDKHSPSVANRDHLFVYSSDGMRFMIPLTYLSHHLFRELLRLSEEEFGMPRDGPITLPCDASRMEHIISLLQSGASANAEKAVLTSIPCARSSMYFIPLPRFNQQQCMTVYAF